MSLIEPENLSLPDDWKIAAIGDVYDFTKKPRGLKLSEYPFIPFIPMEYVPLGKVCIHDFDSKPSAEISSGTYVEKGDFLLAKITPSFENGKQGIVAIDHDFAYATTEVIPIKAKPNLSDKMYLFYLLLNSEIRHELAGKMEGSTGRQRLGKNVLSAKKIPLPPTDEQTKIVAVLSAIQQAVELQENLINNTQELKKALMQKLFTEGLCGEPQKETEIGLVPESWSVNSIGNFCDVKSGGTPSRNENTYWENGKIPWVKTGEIDYCIITETEEHITESGLKNSSAMLFPKGTLLMAMYGQGITRGKVAFLGIEAATNQACAAIFPKTEIEIEILFLYYYFEWQYQRIRNLSHGANQKNLSATIIKSFEIAYPQVAEQNEIAAIFKSIDRKIQFHTNKKQLLTELFNTMLHKLMTAEIRVNELDLTELEQTLAN
ncbi:restriction endonuclease subunit S [Methylomonas koyamae]|uniref:Type I restriction modification DNA specificity domain-containing protein n=1 Tax=Methylomonas koyamae TaxID=702114 RepID=A0AA91DF29_9GAMM|nr:restriction endonuclease subunit S [Methylomonas koyamae]OAI28877.1 hypothetical protein A1356_06125 [Methylomonas koyamae]